MSSSSTSFNRNNVYYQSLPTASSSKQASAAAATSSGSSQKSVNFKSVSSETKNNNTDSKFQSSINTEEFAKLDALLEDLLAEVDQPILLNSDSQPSNSAAATKRPQQRNNHYYTHHHTLPCNDTTTTNSMDWLNEQKEILRARKEASAAQQPYRKIKSKLDYYITSSTVGCNEPVDTNGNDIPIINNKPPVSPSTRQLYSPTTTTTMTNVTQIPIHQQQQQSQPSNNNTNNNPNLTNSFRSLSTNPALLKNINETDDENIIDSEFDRYSQKSYKSIASTIQRTKYHVVSNDYIESTRPTAATPVPMYNPPHSRNNNFYQSKRALSAPPTEIGKVMLQRMELKSPLTVRQTSVVPFEHPQNAITMGVNQNGEQVVLESTNGAAATSGSAVQQRTFIDNPYNNRGVLRPNNYTSLQPQQQQPLLALPQPQQAVPVTRNVYLNRSYSEVPRAAGVYTNGYETDSGLVTQPALAYSTYRQTPQPQIVYAQQQQPIQNGYVEGGEFEQQQQQSMRSAPYRVVGNVGSYRTIGAPQQQRYQLINDQSGYDTDTGLIKLRHVLDSTRRAPSRNMNINGSNVVPVVHQNSSQQTPAPTPTPVGYFSYQPLPNGRCYTPQFNTGHLYNSQQPPMRLNQYTSSQSNIPGSSGMSFIDTQSTQNGFPMDEFTATAATPINPSLIQPITDFQYIDANGNIVKGVPAFVSPDGRQIILKDIDPISGIGEAIITPPPQSFIVQHQVAPSSVSANSTLQRNASTSNAAATTVNGNSNGIRVTTSSTNLATHQPQTQQQQQQQQQQQTINNKLAASVESTSNVVNREETRRSSAASLTGDSSDVIRAYPKFVKATQHYWYKAKISRDEAISLLRDKPPGTFLIRDSNNFPGAYGLALKVDKPPPNVQIKPGADPQNELVRHFLIEPTTKGVRIKGCCNEPIFGSLAALVYQHSLTPLALPIKLILQNQDLTASSTATNLTNGAVNGNHDESASSSRTNTLNKQSTTNIQQTSQQSANTPLDGRQLLDKGAACNVYYLNTVNIESRNGLEGISFALNNTKAFTSKDSTQLLLIQFKVTAQGITISDINKKKFIRQHFPTNSVIYCAVDEKHNWPNRLEKIAKPRIFGVICKPQINKGSNDCHLFVELDPEQPAIAIVDFINRYLIPSKMNLKNVIS